MPLWRVAIPIAAAAATEQLRLEEAYEGISVRIKRLRGGEPALAPTGGPLLPGPEQNSQGSQEPDRSTSSRKFVQAAGESLPALIAFDRAGR